MENAPTIEIKEAIEATTFDPSKFYSSTPFTQAFFYGEWQKSIGRKVWRFLILRDHEVVGTFQVIKYSLIFDKNYLYIPYGPVLNCKPDTSLLEAVKIFLKNLSRKENAVFTRTDFTVAENAFSDELFKKIFTSAPRYTYHSAQFQPRLELYIDLKKSLEDIYNNFHKNTRYSIRVAEKNNVSIQIIERNFTEHFDTFYSILKETAGRDVFGLHSKEYYENIFKQCDIDLNAILVLSSFEEKVLSVNLIILYGDTAMFIFGGTKSERRDVMPAYTAMWSAIQFLKERGYNWYNLGGVIGEKDLHKSWQGLSAFKKRFGGTIVQHADFYDIVASPFWYFIYNLYKKFR